MVSENAKCRGRPCVFGHLHLLTHKVVVFLAEPPNLIIVILTTYSLSDLIVIFSCGVILNYACG